MRRENKRGRSGFRRTRGTCTVATPPELKRILSDPANARSLAECGQLLPQFAANHRTAAVYALLAAGVPVDTRGDHGATALHWACWKGYADLVKLLVEHGASLTIADEAFHAPPAGWFSHGLQNCGGQSGDYPQVARLLLAAGAQMAACDMPSGDAGVDAVLQEHGLI